MTMETAAIVFLGGCMVLSALIIAIAIKRAIETPKNATVNWNPTVYLKRAEENSEPRAGSQQ